MSRFSRRKPDARASSPSSRQSLPRALTVLDSQPRYRSPTGAHAAFSAIPHLDGDRRLPARQVHIRPRIIERSKLSSYVNMLRVFADREPTYRRSTLCDSRRIRREVLYAKNIAGFRGRSPGRRTSGRRSYSRGANSFLSCMR